MTDEQLKYLKTWVVRTMSDYNALVGAMDTAKLGEYDAIRQNASSFKENLGELEKWLDAAAPTREPLLEPKSKK